jgi:hypothetical protein
MVKANKLTQLQATRLKEPGLHGDGATCGSKSPKAPSPILRYAFNGRERWTGWGHTPKSPWPMPVTKPWPGVVMRQGIDPMQVKHRRCRSACRASQNHHVRQLRRALHRITPLGLEERQARRPVDEHAANLRSSIIGKMDVALIETAHIMRVLEPVWHTKAETASRLRGRLEAVLDWATVHRYRTGDNRPLERPPRRTAARTPKVAKSKHFALPWRDMKPFMAELRQSGIGALALQFTILTAARSGEVRGMAWYEVDFEHKPVPSQANA